MKRLIISSLLFILLFILCYPFYLFIIGSIPNIHLPNLSYNFGGHGYLYTRLNEASEYKNVDVLFLGSSHTYRGFDVRIFEEYGLKTFNLGSSSQTPINTRYLLKTYLSSLNPKLIIYALSPDIFISDGVESAVDIISNDKKYMQYLEMISKINNFKLYNVLIYKKLREFVNLDKYYKQPKKMAGFGYIDTYINGGYVEITTEQCLNNNLIKNIDDNINKKQYQLDSFNEIILDLNNRNIKYIFVRTPIANYSGNQEFDEFVEKYGSYYNFNEILNISNNYFYDKDHLKQEGVILFSNKVLEILLNKYF